MSSILIVIIIGLVLLILLKDDQPIPTPLPPLQSTSQLLEELEASEKLKRDYDFVMPDYGMYKGKKIPLGEETIDMLSDAAYLSPMSMGKWVKKGGKK